ncbi:hypothetical protein GK047_17725 [Paenibacillus sp. SYP-B3998]|uniref:DUF4013 domain-containing protein n=1 Tax=Paenibacillus sp. SYP-B3998 TaxID=2678564 RepID=A0A6G4A0C5_9BACL|nr:hypothetical protein [Paenibacillus sp. SYP-B3998]NEW07842.1 hypothetical protein [Paenibacillus sp. SYP-B3998]
MRKLNEMIAQTAVQVYREIIPVAIFSLCSSLFLAIIVFFLPLPFAFLILPLVYVPAVYGVLYAVHRMLKGYKPKLRDVFIGAVRGYVPAMIFGLLCSLFILILFSSWWYYGRQSGMLSLSLAIFQSYFVAMILISQFYTLPLVIQERMGIFSAIGRSVKLFITNPGYTFGAFMQAFCLTVILLVTVVGYGVLFNGMFGIYVHMVTRNLLRGTSIQDQNGETSPLFERDARFDVMAR